MARLSRRNVRDVYSAADRRKRQVARARTPLEFGSIRGPALCFANARGDTCLFRWASDARPGSSSASGPGPVEAVQASRSSSGRSTAALAPRLRRAALPLAPDAATTPACAGRVRSKRNAGPMAPIVKPATRATTCANLTVAAPRTPIKSAGRPVPRSAAVAVPSPAPPVSASWAKRMKPAGRLRRSARTVPRRARCAGRPFVATRARSLRPPLKHGRG